MININLMKKTYLEVNDNIIKKIWSKNISSNLGIYIHNPFCPSQCKYCAYKGTNNNDSIKDYYNYYLPMQIEFYNDIIKQNNISSWFFGGGTPSMMSAYTFRNILSKLPKINENSEKTFELHPGQYDPDIFNVLKEYNFTHIIIGVQTFDQQTLINQNRVPASYEKIKNIVREIQNRGMNVWIDLIGNLDNKNDYNQYKKDIELAISLNPEEISPQLLYKKYTNDVVNKNVDIFYELLMNNENWVLETDYLQKRNISKDSIRHILETTKAVRLFNKKNFIPKQQRKFIDSLLEENISYIEETNSVLGIGSFQNPIHGTMSRVITKDQIYLYTETNNDNKKCNFFITHTPNYIAESKKILSDLEKIKKYFNSGFYYDNVNIKNIYNSFSIYGNKNEEGYAIGNKISSLFLDLQWVIIDDNIDKKLLNKTIDTYVKYYRGKKSYIDLSKL
mgnify:CR=1 FL=1